MDEAGSADVPSALSAQRELFQAVEAQQDLSLLRKLCGRDVRAPSTYRRIIRARLSRRKSPLSALRVSTIRGASSMIRW